MNKPNKFLMTVGSTVIGFAVVNVSQIVSASTLDEVVVTGSREGTEIRNTPATIHKVTEKELARDKPVFFGDVVNRVPGVYVNNLGAEQHMASFRQPINTQGVYLYLEDGVPVRPIGLFNHNQVYELNLTGISDIEIIKGPASSLYGSYAAGGLMNFLTKAPSPGFEAMLGGQLNNRGYKRLDFGLSGTSESGQHAYRLSGYGFDQRNGWAKHSDASKNAFTFRHDFDLGSRQTLKTVLTHTDLYSQMGGSITQTQWNNGQIGESPNTFTYRDVLATRLATTYESEWIDGGLTSVTGIYRSNTTNQVPSFYLVTDTRAFIPNACTNDATGAPSLVGTNGLTSSNSAGVKCGRTLDVAFETFGFDVRHRHQLGKEGSRVIVGAAFDKGSMTGREDRYTYSYIAGGPYTSKSSNIDTLRNYSTDFYNYGVYGQADIALKSDLLAVFGTRYDVVKYDYTRIGSYGVPSSSSTYTGFSPKVGMVYSPDKETNYYANLSTGFAPPEISTKYGGSTQGLTEKTTTLLKEVGLRKKLEDLPLFVDLSVYQLEMKNAVYSSSMSQTFNADSDHKGVELGLRSDISKQISIGFSAAFTDQKYTSAPRNNTAVNTSYLGKDVRYAPKQVANLFASYRPAADTQIVLESQYIGAYWMDEENTREYGGHMLWHARVTKVVGDLEYWLAFRNIGDHRHSEFSNYSFFANYYSPGAPRTILAGIRYNFGGK